MATHSSLSDTELRRRLTELGVSPGPITDSTRATYQLMYQRKVASSKTTSHSHTACSKVVSHGAEPKTPPPLIEQEPRTSPLPEQRPPVALPQQTPLSLSLQTNEVSKPSASTSVLVNLLRVLGDPQHLANDTTLAFSDGTVLCASRAILSSQCLKLTALLYNSQEPFLVTVVTLTGRSCSFHVRCSEYVADLKERLSLTQAIPVDQQRLIHLNTELIDTATIADSGIEQGATIHLVLITTVESHTPLLALPGHTPWLSIAHLKLGLGLDQLEVPSSTKVTPHTTLPSHTCHILHIYDIPRAGFELFVRLLYCGQLECTGDLGSMVVVYILCVYFELSGLTDLCLGVIRSNLITVATATELLTYAETVQCQPLKDVCTSFIQSLSSC